MIAQELRLLGAMAVVALALIATPWVVQPKESVPMLMVAEASVELGLMVWYVANAFLNSGKNE